MAFTIKFDYRFDSNGFFDDAERRATLEAAAAEWEMIIRDDFDEVPAGAKFDINDPSNPANVHEITLTEPIADILIFVGARNFPGTTAAVAGPSGYDIAGDMYRARISDNFREGGAVTNYEPWTGTLSFDLGTNWHDTMAEPPVNKLDLFTVAIHEIGHVLGVGTSGAWDALLTGGGSPTFNGFNSKALNGGNGLPIDPDEGHVADGFANDVVVLDPTLSSGMRMRPSAYDKAILADIGYDIAGFVKQGASPPIATNSAETIFGSDLADAIDGLGGNDQIQTSDGADVAYGGAGADTIFGGTGNDTLLGGTGADQISGNQDDDVIFGDDGGDLLFGGSGEDSLYGGAGNDQIQAGADDDLIAGGAGDDSIFGQAGADVFEFSLGDGADQLYDFDLSNEIIRFVDSGFNSVADALAAISKPFSNVSRITLQDGSYVNVFHDQQSGSPLTAAHIRVTTSGPTPNSAPTGSVSVQGSTFEGFTLNAAVGLADADGLGAFSYMWLRGDQDTGSSNASYTLSAADIGAQISVRVSYVDGQGTAESVTSARSSVVQNVNDAPTGTVLVQGALSEGQTLSANAASLADADGLGNLSYAWLRGGSDTGLGGTTYLLGAADIGQQISVRVSYVDGYGNSETVISAATAAVQNVNEGPTGTVQINGTTAEGNTLVATVSSLNDADGLGELGYVWMRDGIETNVTGANYTLSAADIGARMTVQVSYVDGQGTFETITSAASSLVLNVNDAPVGSVVIAGNATEGSMLLANTQTLADADGLGTISLVWLRDGVETAQTGSTYNLGAADIGAQMAVRASYVDGYGTYESTVSVATAPVQNRNDLPVGKVTIDGLLVEGGTVSVNLSGLSDADGLGAFSFVWLRDGAPTAQNGQTYTLSAADIGQRLSVQVQYNDGFGTLETVQSDETPAVVSHAAQLIGDDGDNAIIGTAADDILSGGAGSDSLEGGAGRDTFDINPGDDAVIIMDFEAGIDRLDLADFNRVEVLAAWAEASQSSSQLTLPDGTTLAFAAGTVNFDTLSLGDVVLAPGDLPATGTPEISGDARQGETLSIDITSVQDVDGIDTSTLSYQWQRDGQNIAGANGTSYTLSQSDVGHAITAVVLFQDFTGAIESVVSQPTSPVENVNDAASGVLSIPPVFVEGIEIQRVLVDVADPDGLSSATPAYQWLRNGVEISGATGMSYVTTAADEGAALSVRLEFVDDFGTLEVLTSEASYFEAIGKVLTGTSIDDIIRATSGADTIDGGSGNDTASFEGRQAAYTVSVETDGVVVTDRRASSESGTGVDILKSIEFLDFDDKIDLFDGPINIGSIENLSNLDQLDFANIIELYIAYFNRAPDAVGLIFWATVFENGFGLSQMAEGFFDQAETRATYGHALSEDGKTLTDPEAFITSVYQNVLGRLPDQDGFDFWLYQLNNNPDITPPSFLLSIINGAKFAADPVPQTFIDQEYLQTKTEIGIYYSAIKGLGDVENASAAMSLFDGSQAGLSNAVDQIDAFYADALDADTGSFLFQLTGILDDPFAIA